MDVRQLYLWCAVPVGELAGDPGLRTPFRLVEDSAQMGRLMAQELADEVLRAARENRECRAIVPCGPNCWYRPFAELVNGRGISLENLVVFHMDECLDWQGRLLSERDPYNFQAFMKRHFYASIRPELAVPEGNRHFLTPRTMEAVSEALRGNPPDITLGGWGQDGHIAYNQARRHPYSAVTLGQLRESGVRIQENNLDTVIALGQRTYGAAYQFVPPMSVTLGVRECLSARKVRVYSDTGAWKQTALRVALFSPPDAEYPLTLLQEHPDALITATRETACHPISLHPEWGFRGVNE